MGGTSTDVSRFGGDWELVFETQTAGVRIQAPQLHIKTVAAGGGSRLFFDNGMFLVGPESAGAHPGPVCYRKNGHLTVTDANLVLGRIQPGHFPHIFGSTEDQPLDVAAARRAMADLTEKINDYCATAGLPAMTMEQAALGFIRVANEVMVRPIREISVMRGFDIKEHILATFGGAGPQHACAIARALGISQIFIHRFSGILSAYGMGMADVVAERQQPFAAVLSPKTLKESDTIFKRLAHEACQELQDQGFSQEQIDTGRFLNLRYHGTDTAIMIGRPRDNDYASAFRAVYRREFGFELSDRQILIDDIRIRARGKSSGLRRITLPKAKGTPPVLDTVQCWFDNGPQETLVYDLEKLGPGHCIPGPAIVIHHTSTILIEPDCTAAITPKRRC